jgi:hypothetical protein
VTVSDYYSQTLDDLPLFAPARARVSDPPTSHAAAKRAPVANHNAMILDALAAGPAGQSEIASRTRLSGLRNDGRIERCGECRSATGGREAMYRLRGK